MTVFKETAPDPAELQGRIDRERLEAAQREWERQDRVRQVMAREVEDLLTQFRAPGGIRQDELHARLEALRDLLAGEWIQSPYTMAEQRQRRAPIIGVARA